MPIIIKDFNWRQTDELIILRVPLKGINLKKVDLFTTDNYLKIHSPPFLFEVCLWRPVLEEESTCIIENGEACFKLVKQEREEWPSLTADLTRQEIVEVKRKAVEEAQAKAAKKREELKVKKTERQRAAVREAINLSTMEQKQIEQTKQQVKTEALAKLGLTPLRHQPSLSITEIPAPVESRRQSLLKKEDKDIFKPERNSFIPAPRQSSQISVSFTPRSFPTPSRESQLAEESEWLRKQAEAQKRRGFVAGDLRPEEQDPQWLCDKAQSLYDVGNYLGAVNAYDHALTLNSQLYELHLGRAAAYLALGNTTRAISDSTKALELLTPAVSQNSEARARCLLIRGTALNTMGYYKEALIELNAAKSLRPNDPDIQSAISQIKI